jgi:hypothetical protein
MIAQKRLVPFPGFAILEPHELKRKIGGYQVPTEDAENAPQIGKIIKMGAIPIEVEGKIHEWYDIEADKAKARELYLPFSVGMIVAYKKFQDFPIQLGTKKYHAVGFEHLLFEVEEVETDGV